MVTSNNFILYQELENWRMGLFLIDTFMINWIKYRIKISNSLILD